MRNFILPMLVVVLLANFSFGQNESYNNNKFKQLYEELPTPNVYRTGSGAPGHEYYQQKADYKIKVTLDDKEQKIKGQEQITYTNNSPDPLSYLWLQLDQNVRAQDSDSKLIQSSTVNEKMSFGQVHSMLNDFDGGFKIQAVTDAKNAPMTYTINKTMMRVDLTTPLKKGESITFNIGWWYNINNRSEIGGRSGYEYFKEEDNYLYTIAQWYPRLCQYNDHEGWQNKQFLGAGEFTLSFGDFEVEITVPADHVVASSGVLQNAKDVLTTEQMKRYETAQKTTDAPVFIITQDEAIANEKSRSDKFKTWRFKAENVRDFAFASSRKFIWDAMAVKQTTKTVMAMSYYPKEGNPLWEKYSTKVVAHTLKVYSKHTFDYPYPVAISVHQADIGMEYPMICFNGGRPEADGTYSERTKYGMIGVIIHEVGHNYFPMIVNSDERQWTWMDEGLNTFLQYLAEQELYPNYPSRRGEPHAIVDYMKGNREFISPIMTNSESIWQFGNNAYGKPATALNILRETILGRELFDYAFKTYANRWMFKHPTPADFFRTMEDASGVDLDWFWRGWFFTNECVDISIEDIKWFPMNDQSPVAVNAFLEEQHKRNTVNISDDRNNREIEYLIQSDSAFEDFYNTYNQFGVDALDKERYDKFLAGLSDDDKAILEAGYHMYQIDFKNIGGLVMPVIIEFTYVDGTTELVRIPAELWRKNNEAVSKVFILKKQLKSVKIDPYQETADVDTYNNAWPREWVPTQFELYKRQSRQRPNPMQRAAKHGEKE